MLLVLMVRLGLFIVQLELVLLGRLLKLLFRLLMCLLSVLFIFLIWKLSVFGLGLQWWFLSSSVQVLFCRQVCVVMLVLKLLFQSCLLVGEMRCQCMLVLLVVSWLKQRWLLVLMLKLQVSVVLLVVRVGLIVLLMVIGVVVVRLSRWKVKLFVLLFGVLIVSVQLLGCSLQMMWLVLVRLERWLLLLLWLLELLVVKVCEFIRVLFGLVSVQVKLMLLRLLKMMCLRLLICSVQMDFCFGVEMLLWMVLGRVLNRLMMLFGWVGLVLLGRVLLFVWLSMQFSIRLFCGLFGGVWQLVVMVMLLCVMFQMCMLCSVFWKIDILLFSLVWVWLMIKGDVEVLVLLLVNVVLVICMLLMRMCSCLLLWLMMVVICCYWFYWMMLVVVVRVWLLLLFVDRCSELLWLIQRLQVCWLELLLFLQNRVVQFLLGWVGLIQVFIVMLWLRFSVVLVLVCSYWVLLKLRVLFCQLMVLGWFWLSISGSCLLVMGCRLKLQLLGRLMLLWWFLMSRVYLFVVGSVKVLMLLLGVVYYIFVLQGEMRCIWLLVRLKLVVLKQQVVLVVFWKCQLLVWLLGLSVLVICVFGVIIGRVEVGSMCSVQVDVFLLLVLMCSVQVLVCRLSSGKVLLVFVCVMLCVRLQLLGLVRCQVILLQVLQRLFISIWLCRFSVNW